MGILSNTAMKVVAGITGSTQHLRGSVSTRWLV
jgi:hypothetical protein